MMKLYIVSRWGNPHDPDGPDAPDTNFLVRASSRAVAVRLVDRELRLLPWRVGTHRPVARFAQFVIEVGENAQAKRSAVVHGPWIAHAIIRERKQPRMWRREKKGGRWWTC